MEEISKVNKRYASFLMYLLFIWVAWFSAAFLLDHLLLRSWLHSIDKETRFIINAIGLLTVNMSVQSVIFIYNFIFWVRNRKNYKLALNFYVLWLLMFLSALFGGVFWGTRGMILAGSSQPVSINVNVWFSLGIILGVSFLTGLVFIIIIAIHKIDIISGPMIEE